MTDQGKQGGEWIDPVIVLAIGIACFLGLVIGGALLAESLRKPTPRIEAEE